ncbi:MAG: hypothetical protein NTV59_03015 [Chloroflexi bacterium]|nr:hypothetical protein [Chloroflexota bacterium]
MPSKAKKSILEPPAKFVSEKVLSLEVKAVEKYVPDKLLLLFMNTLDKRASPRTINAIVDKIEKYISAKVRDSLLALADEYVPDTVANSRKVSTVIAGVGKYIPDRIIPSESAEKWSNLKIKFSIPTLLIREGKATPPGD